MEDEIDTSHLAGRREADKLSADRITATAVLANQIGELKATVEGGFARLENRLDALEHRTRSLEDWRVDRTAVHRTEATLLHDGMTRDGFQMTKRQFYLAMTVGGFAVLSVFMGAIDFAVRLITSG